MYLHIDVCGLLTIIVHALQYINDYGTYMLLYVSMCWLSVCVGLRAVAMGYQAILCGDAEVVVAGGQESMSQVILKSKYMQSK